MTAYEVRISDWSSDVCSSDLYIITLGPLFAILWTLLGRRGLEPSTPAKFGLALVQLGVGFLILVAGAAAAGPSNLTPVLFIFLLYLFHTTGELCLSPVGLSAMNRLAPAHMAGLIMGTWFFARSEEHTSELQSLMRISYAVFCLKKK